MLSLASDPDQTQGRAHRKQPVSLHTSLEKRCSEFPALLYIRHSQCQYNRSIFERFVYKIYNTFFFSIHFCFTLHILNTEKELLKGRVYKIGEK